MPEAIWEVREITQSDADATAHYLADSLGLYLGTQVMLGEVTVVDNEAFSCGIHSRDPTPDPFALQWRGVLGAEPIDGAQHISATLCLFSGAKRLSVQGVSSATLELVLRRDTGGGATWASHGWREDEYGEWETLPPPP